VETLAARARSSFTVVRLLTRMRHSVLVSDAVGLVNNKMSLNVSV